MKGFIEVRESSYEDSLEHLHKIKQLACKIMKALSEEHYDEDEERDSRTRGRYGY